MAGELCWVSVYVDLQETYLDHQIHQNTWGWWIISWEKLQAFISLSNWKLVSWCCESSLQNYHSFSTQNRAWEFHDECCLSGHRVIQSWIMIMFLFKNKTHPLGSALFDRWVTIYHRLITSMSILNLLPFLQEMLEGLHSRIKILKYNIGGL